MFPLSQINQNMATNDSRAEGTSFAVASLSSSIVAFDESSDRMMRSLNPVDTKCYLNLNSSIETDGQFGTLAVPLDVRGKVSTSVCEQARISSVVPRTMPTIEGIYTSPFAQGCE